MDDQITPDGEVPGTPSELSHLEGQGTERRARMVDVGAKKVSERTALAAARLRFPAGVLERVLAGQGPKGPVEEVARVAGVLAAKGTGQLIPMCHPLALDHVEVSFEPFSDGPDTLEVRCSASCRGRTGVEMEALTGAAVAALTVYDMTKALSKGIVLESVRLLEKSGGRSGTWRAPRGA